MEMAGYPPQTFAIKHGFNAWILGNLLFGSAIGR